MGFLILDHCEGLEAALQGGLQAVNGGYNIEAGQAGQDASYQPFHVNMICLIVCVFVCLKGRSGYRGAPVPPLPDESNPYLQSSPKYDFLIFVGILNLL